MARPTVRRRTTGEGPFRNRETRASFYALTTPNNGKPRAGLSEERCRVLSGYSGQVVAMNTAGDVPVLTWARCELKTKLSDIKLMWQCGPPNVDWSARFSDGCPDATGANARSPATVKPTKTLRMLVPFR